MSERPLTWAIRWAAAGLAVAAVAAGAAKPVTLTGRDGTVQITLPAGWAQTASPSPSAQLAAMNEADQCALLLIAEDRADLTMTLGEYAQRAVDQLKQVPQFTHASATELRPLTVGGRPAVRCQFRCDAAGGLKLVYVLTFVQGEHAYENVQAWTMADRFDRERPAMEGLAAAVGELFPAVPVAAPAAAAGAAVTVEAKDHTARLTVPPNYAQAPLPPGTPDQVQAMATDAATGACVLVSTESRQGTTTTLPQYARRMVEQMSKSPVNRDASHTPFTPVKVAGHDALRCRFSSTTNGIRLTWLLTAIQTDGYFHEVDGWCPRSRFAALEPALAKLPEGLVEVAPQPVTVEGKDHAVRLTLPAGFARTDLPPGMPDTVQLLAVDDAAGICAMVLTEPVAASKLTPTQYGEAVVARMGQIQANADVTHTPFTATRVGGRDAVRSQVQTTTNGSPFTWLVWVFKAGDSYVQVSAWCPGPQFAAARPTMERVPDGLQTGAAKK